MLKHPLKRLIGARGFTLIELMVVVCIFAILLLLAVPGLQEWVGRASVRAAIEDVQNAMQIAQAEAAKRNQHVEFALFAEHPAPNASNILNTAATANGVHWAVRVLPTTGSDKEFVQKGNFKSRRVKVTGDASIVFNGLGQTLSAPSKYLTTTKVYRVTTQSDKYPICVFVRPGGGLRWCDPRFSGNPLACPADITCPAS
ncbi:pilin [Betaproteobacteria bacterium]|nr:pilin [Betaproteobacteria bacterium]GHU10850.1 pilin [Betaproteobacteria bacterium]GHU46770.1 pilin [Betaproteobacteria bacterium]